MLSWQLIQDAVRADLWTWGMWSSQCWKRHNSFPRDSIRSVGSQWGQQWAIPGSLPVGERKRGFRKIQWKDNWVSHPSSGHMLLLVWPACLPCRACVRNGDRVFILLSWRKGDLHCWREQQRVGNWRRKKVARRRRPALYILEQDLVIVHSYDGNIGGRWRILTGPERTCNLSQGQISQSQEQIAQSGFEKTTLISPSINMIGICSVAIPLPL